MITYLIARIRYWLVRLVLTATRLRYRCAVAYWLHYYGDPVLDAWKLSDSLWCLATGFPAHDVVIAHLNARYSPQDSFLKRALQSAVNELGPEFLKGPPPT
jgi:hypothetical protein